MAPAALASARGRCGSFPRWTVGWACKAWTDAAGRTIELAEFHGALMISGFLGTVISLERAVAIGRWWAYSAPALSGIAAVTLIVGAPVLAGGIFLLAGIPSHFSFRLHRRVNPRCSRSF